ncbi:MULTISPECIES: N-acetylmuramoyl-L-alanine amidase [unclassified Lentilitoribacter]|jgi:N-acetylmuramoyl-L-alanine amidase|uniref:N-acetylmuramoyl-L-alanine amidase n=1 Tax=unclassified Lentilitoribacter TaxID=2647570 RepID=UPI0013A68BD5|nr:N-acetylmuramoyl-L-alanine amidase [Lentilitoribacter sp. Alg239-R112]
MTFAPDFDRAIVVPSPNFGERKGVSKPDMLVLHYTAMETAKAACDWLCAEEAEVSAHYLVDENGEISQLVAEEKRAWHAGQSSWHGEVDINSRSIGIEVANQGHEAGCPIYPDVQMQSVIGLSRSIIARHNIDPKRVLAHSDIAPLRKRDPGEWFSWKALADQGVGHYVDPSPISGGRYFMRGESGQPIEALQSMLGLYGYGLEVNGQFDELTEAVIIAFQRHFRPEKVDGIADMSTIETLHRLLAEN